MKKCPGLESVGKNSAVEEKCQNVPMDEGSSRKANFTVGKF